MRFDNDAIGQLLDQMDNESKALREEALRMSWYMRGGLTYDMALMLSDKERVTIRKIIEDNLKVTKDSGVPFF